jgi:hypothetical protein
VDSIPFCIKGETVRPKDQVKILGVVMDSELRYKQHIAMAATKGLEAAMALRRFKGLSPSVARHLFVAMVAPVIGYASNVWMHACKEASIRAINRVQRLGAQAIVGTFHTVATAVAEAEADILPVRERFAKRAIKLWIDLQTLPDSNPLRRIGYRTFRRFVSPLQRIANAHQGIPVDRMETIHPFALGPWEERVQLMAEDGAEKVTEAANAGWAVRIATSSSARNDMVGIGGAIRIPESCRRGGGLHTFSITLGTRAEQNPYTAELAAMAKALQSLPTQLCYRVIIVFTSNKAAALAVGQPRQQSGQEEIRHIYDAVETLRENGNKVSIAWIPSGGDFELARVAKEAARRSTKQGCLPNRLPFRARPTTLSIAKAERQRTERLPEGVGKYSKKVDSALPGRHTRKLYDLLTWKEARVLAQLRTGMARLNGYLYQIGAATTHRCPCGQAKETVDHFLFRCRKWTSYRAQMLQCTDTRRGNLSFYLGGKATSDPQNWAPDIEAVRATVGYAIATGRLDE